MNTILLAIAFSIFIFGAVVSNKSIILKSRQNDISKHGISEDVLSETDDEGAIEKEEENNNGTNPASPSETTPSPTVKPFPTLITLAPVRPTTAPVTENLITKFIYPGSSVIENSSSNLSLTSNDDPKSISDWYKAKIKEINFTTTTSVFTQANDKYLIKLSGVSGSTNIMIEVTKEGNESAKINVSIN